jgi:hypothetical protein
MCCARLPTQRASQIVELLPHRWQPPQSKFTFESPTMTACAAVNMGSPRVYI